MHKTTLQAAPRAIITIDKDRLREVPPGSVLVESVADYPRACQQIRHALHQVAGEPLEVCVRQRAVARWLSERASSWGSERVVLRQHTAAQELRERWRIEVPVTVSDADIFASRLMQEDVRPEPGQSFDDALLAHFFSPELLFAAFPLGRLAVLLSDYDEERWKAARKRPLAAQALAARLKKWEESASNEALRTLVRRLRDDPELLRRDLGCYKLLRGYPSEVVEKVLSKRAGAFRKARVDTDDLKVNLSEVAAAATAIDYYLAERRKLVQDAAGVEALVGEVSGHLNREFYVVDEILRARPEWLSTALLRQIERRFAPIAPGLGSGLAALRKLIQPPYPQAPDDAWETSLWLQWARHSYMPYYAWLEEQNRRDEMVAGYAVQFADWFYEHYLGVKNAEPQRFSFSALYGERDRIRAEGALSLVLLVDNFNWVHFDEMCRLFREQGMALEAAEPLLSSIPTATEVGKAGLIAMDGNQDEHPSESYPALVQKTWGTFLNGKTASYLANVGQMQEMRELEHDVLFLNFLPIDRALHEDSQQTGQPHSEAIRGALETLAKSVGEFAKRFEIGHRLKVYVLSDHGSTRIGQGTVNVLDKSFYKSLADAKHHRYLALADDKFAALPQVAQAQCYLVDRQKFGTHKNFLAARGHYRFSETTDDFYVHGGLTPEEVVVPFARFSFEPPAPQPPTIHLPQSEFRYAVKSQLVLRVGNPNGFALSELSLVLMDSEGEEAVIENLAPHEEREVKFETVFRRTAQAAHTRVLSVRTRFECQGQYFQPEDTSVEITLKTMMEVKDDDFDF